MSAGKMDKRPKKIGPAREGERGYALISLLAMMTIMALLLVNAVPNYRRMAQRELEEEAIARGEQVAEAIRLYVREKRVPPTSIEQLLEGLPRGTKKIQILRAAAARDPLSSSGEWRLIRRNDPGFMEFVSKVTAYAGRTPNTTDQSFIGAPGVGPPPVVTNVLDTGSAEEAPGGEDDSADTSGPFIGVASRSRRNSVITYYGIERHDRWVFTPYFR